MELANISESYLLSLTQEQNNLYIELIALDSNGVKIKVFANNKDTSAISVSYIGLSLNSSFTTVDGIPTLGEIESVAITNFGFTLEGDMGIIKVTADNWLVEKAL